MNSTTVPGNIVLTALTASDQDSLRPLLEPVSLRIGQHLERANRSIRAVYFLESGLASVISTTLDGRHNAEVAMVGREGMSGTNFVLGAEMSPFEMVVRIEGVAQRIAAEDLRTAMTRSMSLTQTLMRWASAHVAQVSQNAVVQVQGTLLERLARWLLMAHDRVDGTDVFLTHKVLATALTVRRAGITAAMHRLQKRSLIAAARGRISVLDRRGLEQIANGLYGTSEAHFNDLFDLVAR